jgi:hypothetical protein
MKLFEPAWKTATENRHLEKAFKSLEKCGETTLKEVVLNAPRHEVRSAALNKITDQTVLADLAKTSPESGVRRQAAVKLTDSAAVTAIAKSDSDAEVRRALIEVIADTAALTDIAKTEQDLELVLLAMSKIDDQNTFADLAKNNKHWKVRFRAAQLLTDNTLAQEVFASLVTDEKATDSQKTKAVDKLTDEIALARVAMLPTTLSKKIWALREQALAKITTADILKYVAENAKEESVQKAATARLQGN